MSDALMTDVELERFLDEAEQGVGVWTCDLQEGPLSAPTVASAQLVAATPSIIRWLVKRAQKAERQIDDQAESAHGPAGSTKPCSRCNGTGREADPCCGHVTVLGESCPDGCCLHDAPNDKAFNG